MMQSSFLHFRLLLTRLLTVLALVVASGAAGATPSPLVSYNVVWDSPSKNSDGSMPIGNGDIGANVWVEPSGDLLLLLSKTDAWDELGRIIKLGQLRVKLSPNAFAGAKSFHQELDLHGGRIVIRAEHAQHGKAEMRVWFDANHPVARIEIDTEKPTTVSVQHETWRTAPRELRGKEFGNSSYGLAGTSQSRVVHPDTVLDDQTDRVVFFHRNNSSIWADTLRVQSLEEMLNPANDPLMHLTSGAMVRGPGLVAKGKGELVSAQAAQSHRVNVYPHVARTDTAEQWVRAVEGAAAAVDKTPLDAARAAHGKWWEEFWARHWIFVDGGRDTGVVTRGYVLQRWVNACGGRGNLAIKFNGSIFTLPVLDRDGKMVFDPDYRVHGPCFWWQNTRLPYWPMLMAGDYDLMQPLFKMYSDMLPLRKLATKKHYQHEGAYIPETVYFWGTHNNENYGWNRDKLAPGLTVNQHIRYEWVAGIELTAMMLDYHAHTQDEKFLRETLLPFAAEIATFYARHYQLNEQGKLHIFPANSLENMWDATNPAEVVSGFRAILPRLIALTREDRQRQAWARLLEQMPELPTGKDRNGKIFLAGADKARVNRRNAEESALYALFPFRLLNLLTPEALPPAELAYQQRATQRGIHGWIQHAIFAACLGRADQARAQLVSRSKYTNGAQRFPATWRGFDWLPDQCHGGINMIILQNMLMQPVGEKILLLPAWPKEWNVQFKLHAPQNTVVEGEYRDGKIQELKVTPESRRKDIVFFNK